MALFPVECTTTLPCKNLSIADINIGLKWDTSDGKLVKGTDNAELAGKCIVVDKNLDMCTLEYAGVLRLPVADSVTLTSADRGKKVVGGANGTVKPVSEPSAFADVPAQVAYFKHAKGRIIGFSNDSGDKYVDVAGFFG